MKASEKVERILKYLDVNAKSFSEMLGYERPQIIYDIQKGKTKRISSELASKITSVFSEINRSWLLADEGEMLLSEKNNHESPSSKDGRLIPFYDAETTGGFNGRVSASDEGSLKGYIQPGGWFDGRETAAIRHVGDSMVEYPDGCVLAVREVLDKHLLVLGRNYVIETREYRVTKRVQRGSTPNSIMLYSSNSEKYDDGRLVHEPFEVALEDVLHIFSVLGYIVNQSGEFRLIKP